MKLTPALVLLLAAGSPLPAQLITNLDTFDDGTTSGWFVGDASHPTPPTNIATGGPAGAGDNYLQLQAINGSQLGSRLSVLNGSQWAGNYLSSGITGLRMDVKNFGPDDLHLRLLFEDFAGAGPPANLALSKVAVIVPAGSEWQSVSFALTPDALIPGIFGSVAGALASVDVLRLFHNIDAVFPGPGLGPAPVTAVLGVDNITAFTPVPEPATYLAGVALVGGCVLAWRRRRLAPSQSPT